MHAWLTVERSGVQFPGLVDIFRLGSFYAKTSVYLTEIRYGRGSGSSDLAAQ